MKKFDNKKYTFVEMPGKCGGYGLAPVDTPDARHALPERRPGGKGEWGGINGEIVLSHQCQAGYWYWEGILDEEGTFWRP